MLTTEEIQAAELEQKVIPTDEVMDAYNEYHRLKAQRDALNAKMDAQKARIKDCLLYTSPSPRDGLLSRMPSSA